MTTDDTRELMRTLPCLSIRQPWAWFIVRPDLTTPEAREAARKRGELKDVENLVWQWFNPARKFRGRFLIHAGIGGKEPEQREDYEDSTLFALLHVQRDPNQPITIPEFEELPRGGIVGVGEVADYVVRSASPWFVGPGALVLANVEPVPFVACRGMLGFFTAKEAA